MEDYRQDKNKGISAFPLLIVRLRMPWTAYPYLKGMWLL